MMKILVIDGLTETFTNGIVRSGLQKSSKLDAEGLSTSHGVGFMYCGDFSSKYNFRHIKVSNLGSKDYCLQNNLNPKTNSSFIIKRYLKNNINELNKYEKIIVQVHSFSSFYIDELVNNKKIIFILHDILDNFYYSSLSKRVSRLSGNNQVKILTSSQYSIDRCWSIHRRNNNKLYMLKPTEIFEGFIDHVVWTNTKPLFTKKENFSAVIGRFEKSKYHHKLFGFTDSQHTINHYGIKDIRRDADSSYYNRLVKSGNIIKEAYSDEELYNDTKKAKNIIIPCWHEGFGFTAFEAGIYGAIPIILYNDSPSQNIGHATAQYLERAGVYYKQIEFTSPKEELFNLILTTSETSDDIRRDNSAKLLNYFSLDNYILERVKLFEGGFKNIKNNKQQQELFTF